MSTATTDIQQELERLRARLGVLALDGDHAELARVEAEISRLERLQERQRLAGLEQQRRDAIARRDAEVAAHEQARSEAIAYERRRLEGYATVTAAAETLRAAIVDTLVSCPDHTTFMQLGDFIAGELTDAGLELFGMRAPRRPLPAAEGE